MTFEEAQAKMREAGEAHGLSAASRYFDGNTTEETYRNVLQGIEDGDPEVMDSFPSGPLSGEWADDPTPTTVFQDVLGLDLHAEASFNGMNVTDELLDAYEEGFYKASQQEIERVARLQLS